MKVQDRLIIEADLLGLNADPTQYDELIQKYDGVEGVDSNYINLIKNHKIAIENGLIL